MALRGETDGMGQGDMDEAGAGMRCCMGHVEADGLQQAA